MMLLRLKYLIILCFLLSGCHTVKSKAYQEFYSYLEESIPKEELKNKSDYFVTLFVNARHLDYTDNVSFLKSLAESENHDFGHSWIYLQGVVDGQVVFIEGGHSGELGTIQAKYFDGVMNYLDFGHATVDRDNLPLYRYEANPIKYLWEVQHDGYFQYGSGGHQASCSLTLDLNEQQFFQICDFIKNYRYSEYAITGNQCSSFVSQIAFLAGVCLESELTIEISPKIVYGGDEVLLWSDHRYSKLTISSPDILEKSIMKYKIWKCNVGD